MKRLSLLALLVAAPGFAAPAIWTVATCQHESAPQRHPVYKFIRQSAALPGYPSVESLGITRTNVDKTVQSAGASFNKTTSGEFGPINFDGTVSYTASFADEDGTQTGFVYLLTKPRAGSIIYIRLPHSAQGNNEAVNNDKVISDYTCYTR